MSSRCVACNEPFLFIADHPHKPGDLDDMCQRCKAIARSEYRYTEDHEFLLEDAEEGVTEMKDMSNY